MGWLSVGKLKGTDAVVPPSSSNASNGPSPTIESTQNEVVESKRPRKLTRDEQAEVELQQFLQELEEPQSSRTKLSSKAQQASEVDTSPISQDKLFPTTMSCRAAFDSAFYCQSLGGQFTNLYRYGGMRDCSEQWSNFWFCMRTNRGFMTDEERKDKIQAHYKSRARKYVVGPSSEDVWKLRQDMLQEPFEGDLEAAEAEWEQMQKNKGS
jgi:hypothetical protein